MGRSMERARDSQVSVWSLEPAEPPDGNGWLQAWQRWAAKRRLRRAKRDGVHPQDHAFSEATTPLDAGRGQALRQAYGALRDRMRAQRDLRRVLPHLYFIERALSRKGSSALAETPIWVLQRGLQQLSRLPADNLEERGQLSVLQQRLVEAIRARSLMADKTPRAAEMADSFLGGADSQVGSRWGLHTSSDGLEISEVPRSVFDDLTQGSLPGRAEAANTPG